MRTYLLNVLLLMTIAASAQQTPAFTPPVSVHKYYNPAYLNLFDQAEIQLYTFADFYSGSNSLPAGFVQTLLFGSFIDDARKDKASEQLKTDNTAGFDLNSGVWFSTYLGDSNTYRLHLGVEYQIHRGLAYTPHLFELAFYGNAGLADQTADISNSSYDGAVWMSYRTALSRLYPTSKGLFSAAIGASFLQGLSGENLEIERGLIYTAPDGSYLDLDYQFTFNTSDTKVVRLGNTKGIGTAGDLFLSWESPGKRWFSNFAFTDFGVISWNKTPLQYQGDSSSRFEGIDITDVLTAGSDAAIGNEELLMEYVQLDSNTNAFTTVLPMRLEWNTTYYIPEKMISLSAGVHHRLQTEYSPLFYLRAGKVLPASGTHLSVVGSVGGYGSYGLGLDIHQRIGPYIRLNAGSSSLLGFIAPDQFFTEAVYLAISIGFNP